MAAVDSVLVQSGLVDPATARREFSRVIWNWYNAHKNDVLHTVGVGFFSFKLKVSHARKVFEQIAGMERDVV
jgi:hypothetical protein